MGRASFLFIYYGFRQELLIFYLVIKGKNKKNVFFEKRGEVKGKKVYNL